MSQTQLASMFLGNPLVADRDDRLRGVSSQINATVHILDGQSYNGEILDYITAKNIISDTHRKSLTDTLETYNFITFADKRFSQFLEKRNRIIIPDEDGTLREFVTFEAAKYRDSEGHKAQVFSHASYLELKKAKVLYPDSYKGTASQHAGRTLNDTGWQVGIVGVSGNITISRSKHTNPYEFIRRIAKEFDAELRFRIEHDGNKVVGRYVDLLERVGEWRGREVEFGKDLEGIRRVEKQNIVTALLGLGPEDEDGNRIEVLVEDNDALKRWGRVDEYGKLHHLVEPYEIQSEREDMTVAQARQYTRTALNKRINTSVTYECSIVDLENVPGMENKKIRHGDTIRIKDTHFNPPLYLEARVFESDRSIKSNAKKDIKLGDFIEFTEEEVNAIWIMLQREIRKKIDIETLKEYAEPKKIESPTAPVIKTHENPIWVDTSQTPKVPYVVIGGEWQKMSPTTPAEVDAYTKLQVDKKANDAQAQALADAKAFSKNASNIDDGIIDVGAVPLRLSATGASIEFDGVNGFYMKDSQGNYVVHFDLDGNARLVNAFLSGRIEALEGYFGADQTIRIRDGKVEFVRPDGAVSMLGGLDKGSQPIEGFNPMFMTDSIETSGYRADAFGAVSGYLFNRVGYLDGRDSLFRDVRDSDYRSSVRVQRYQFIHTARYLVITYRSRTGIGEGYGGDAHQHLALIYDNEDNKLVDHSVPTNAVETVDLIADLGVPTYKELWVDFRLGWAAGWGNKDDYINFRINNVRQTDFV